MTETLLYINNTLKGLYPPGEVGSFIRLIMEHVCGISPQQLLLGKDRQISDTEKARIQDIVTRLSASEPIQYILGETEFYGLTLRVTPAVLIPRPETEELVEKILQDHPGQALKILDIGTGSGCIAIALQKQLKDSEVVALDISSDALRVARLNAERQGAAITFIQTDILASECADADVPFLFDLIVSNPPYVKESEKRTMEKNVLLHEPHTALFVADDDPLLFYRHIARFGKKKLKPNGWLYFEINAQCGALTTEMLRKEGYREVERIRDLSGNDRIIKARR